MGSPLAYRRVWTLLLLSEVRKLANYDIGKVHSTVFIYFSTDCEESAVDSLTIVQLIVYLEIPLEIETSKQRRSLTLQRHWSRVRSWLS